MVRFVFSLAFCKIKYKMLDIPGVGEEKVSKRLQNHQGDREKGVAIDYPPLSAQISLLAQEKRPMRAMS